MTHPAALTECLSAALLPHPPERLGIAVSGGGDSTALLHLSADFCGRHAIRLHAVTVNHNLRPEACEEARKVAATCQTLGVPHDTLAWHDDAKSGNLQGKAREGRYALMADWARQSGIQTIALGHTSDDQAETVLLRLARRAGVDGLSAMQPRRIERGIAWLRPFLGISRESLRRYLRENGLGWSEDPSNDDLGYDRIKARAALKTLAGLGIDATALTEVAQNMRDARTALNWQAFTNAREIACVDGGAVVICQRRLRILPDEIQRRILLGAVAWVTNAVYPPRRGAVRQLMLSLQAGQAATLDGCHACVARGQIWVFREYRAVETTSVPLGEIWDNRWQIMTTQPHLALPGATVRALGKDGLAQCDDWRETGRPRRVIMSSPSLWKGDQLIAAPLAGMAKNWQVHLQEGAESFYSGLLSH